MESKCFFFFRGSIKLHFNALKLFFDFLVMYSEFKDI